MLVTDLYRENFNHYKLPSMVIGCVYCNWKCCKEAGLPISTCQNQSHSTLRPKNYTPDEICQEFISDPIEKAIVFAGLEPFEQYSDMCCVIITLREKYKRSDPVIIYTGYTQFELENEILFLSRFENIIVKFGRFIPGQEKHRDDVLGVVLASNNQYAKYL